MKIEDLRSCIAERFRKEQSFVIYRKPGSESLLAWLPDSAKISVLSEQTKPGFLFAPFDPGGSSIQFPLSQSVVLEVPFEYRGRSDSMGFNEIEERIKLQSRERHLKLVAKALADFEMGNAEKIVLSRKEEVRYVEQDPFSIFLQLAFLYPRAFSYLWYHPEVGTWVGASPETLVRAEGSVFSTMSLAGTQRFDKDQEAVWGEKEIEEQRLVTHLIRQELGTMITEVGTPYTQRAGQLLHLRTDIRGSVQKESDLVALIKRLHPTAAVCGLPRNQAFDFIVNNEGYDRQFYTGFLGEFRGPEPGTTQLFVNLRCMQLFPDEKKAWIYVGGGVTSSSDPEREWEETCAKTETMKRVFS